MMQFIITEVFALVYVFYAGRHDAPACDHFAEYGVHPTASKIFHATNFKAKCAVGAIALLQFHSCKWYVIAMMALALMFIMWMPFNISLNLRRNPRKPWDYLSEGSNTTDRSVQFIFKNNAGMWLTIVSAALVVALNSAIIIFINR